MKKLLKYIEKHRYIGYDPYDLKGKKWYIDLDNNLKNEFEKLNNLYPQELRNIFKIKPKLNNKALALIGLSYINLNKTKKAKKIAKLLLKKANKNHSGLCWGYPFNWKSGNYLFPKNTPSIVVTTTVGNFYIELFKITKKRKYLKILKSIVKFIVKDLKQTKLKDTICFSYTPYDNYQIHNANLMGAEFLAKMGNLLNDTKLLELSLKSTYFTINQQNKDGSIYYYGNNSSTIAPIHLDIYHSGFEIRSLISLYEIHKHKKIKKAFMRYLNFFIHQYFIDGCIPKLAPKIKNYTTDIVDIHGLAESLLTLNKASKYINTKKLLKDICIWGKKNMQTEQGYFLYRWIRENNTITKVDIAYMRWGQAWMLYALSSLESSYE